MLHRCRPGWKLAMLVGLGVTVSLLRESLWVLVLTWAVVVLGFVLMYRWRLAGLELVRHVWRLKWLAVLIVVPQLVFLSPEDAAMTTARILGLVILAGLFTLTTSVSAVMDLVVAGFKPLERAGLGRLGLTAERVSLAMALTMRSVPVVFGFYSDIRHARRARGATASVASAVSMTTPLLVMSLRHAEETSEALTARGLR